MTSLKDNKSIMSLLRTYNSILRKFNLEFRAYQYWLLTAILKATAKQKNILVELDAGMGKRIIMFMLTQIFSKKKILILTPSRASVWDMTKDFEKFTNSTEWFGIITGGMPSKYRLWILQNKRVIIATPFALFKTLSKISTITFDLIIINEIDKAIKRTAMLPTNSSTQENPNDNRIVYMTVHPWNLLLKLLPKNAVWIGLSGTLRDTHFVHLENSVIIKPELESIIEFILPNNKPVVVISMDSLIEKTDIRYHVIKNLTLIKPVGVDDEQIKLLDKAISTEIDRVLQQIKEYYQRLYPEEPTPLETKEKISRTINFLPQSNPLRIKFLRLALARRFIYAGIPEHYRRFIQKPMFRRITQEYLNEHLDNLIPNRSTKIAYLERIIPAWTSNNKNVVILTSFIRTALSIKKVLENIINKQKLFLLTGKTFNKRRILETFQKTSNGVLILTPVAERDLDFPNSDLLIIHDIISTVKSMYQRIKRIRRGTVIILYYRDTYEEKKLGILLSRLSKRYPWSIRILPN